MTLCTPAACADVIYVDDSATGGSTGLTWADAYTRLTAGIAAAEPGDEIRIGQGTYRPAGPGGNRHASFEILEAIALIGGYSGVGAADPDANDPAAFATILSGDLIGDDNNNFANSSENVFHVVVVDAVGVVIEGVTIRDGHGAGLSTKDDESGAGIRALDGATIDLTNCRIQNNQALLAGAGIYAENATINMTDCVVRKNRGLSTPSSRGAGAFLGEGSSITGCTFALNAGGVSGGGLSATHCTISQTVFHGNSADRGGAIVGADLIITDCTFIDNAAIEGGALSIGNATVAGCTFEANHSGSGAAIRTSEADPVVTIEDCAFRNNNGSSGTVTAFGVTNIVRCDFLQNSTTNDGFIGGAIFNLGVMSLALCGFNGNSADAFDGRGGAVYNSGTLRAVSCLFSGNAAGAEGGALRNTGICRLFNCTFAGNTCNTLDGGGAIFNADTGDLRLYNCIVWGNSADGDTSRRGQAFNDEGMLIFRSSIVQGMPQITLDPLANSGANPKFRDADGPDNLAGTEDDDLRLRNHSPARNTGRNEFLPADVFDLDGDADTAEPSSRDLDDRARIRHGTVDRGALES